MVEFRVLGPIEVADGARRIQIGAGKERAVLALLLLDANRVVPVDRLIEDTWGGDPPHSAHVSLRVLISRLRKSLGTAGAAGLLRTQAPGYLMAVERGTVDSHRFEALLGRGTDELAHRAVSEAAATLRDALALWRGPAYAEVADAPGAVAGAARLEELRVVALERRVEADLACGRHGDLVAELEGACNEHPLRERLWAHHMTALYGAGRQADALRVYTRLRERLADELGIDPSPELQALEAAVLQQDVALAPPIALVGPATATGGEEALTLPLPELVSRAGRDTFVAREDELDVIDAAWNDAVAGRRRVVLMAGDPGIGKTRLLGEVAARIHAAGGVVVAGRCDADPGAAYQPFVEALTGFAAACRPERLPTALGDLGGELVRLVPELTSLCPGLPAPMVADPDTERARLFDAVDRWLVAVGNGAPVALVVDDLHWAAQPTVSLLRHLSQRTEGRVLLLGAYRQTELDRAHPLADALADLRRQPDIARLTLRGFDVDATVAYLETVGGQALQTEGERDVAVRLRTQTDGNPFFLREMVRHLVDVGAVSRAEGGWRFATDDPVAVGLPEGVKEVVGRRLSALAPATNRVLEVASVIGPSFTAGLLALVPAGTADGADVIDAIDEALRADLVREEGQGVYAFAHALVRQVLYEELTSIRRVRLHRQVGEALESRPDRARHLPALAHHFAEAAFDGQALKAADYGVAAGRQARLGLGAEQARSLLERALAALEVDEGPQPGRRGELLYELARTYWQVGDRSASRRLAEEAAVLGRGLPDPALLVRSAMLLAALTGVNSGDPRPAEWCHEALARVDPDDLATRARLFAALARHAEVSSVEDREDNDYSHQALALARRLDDPVALINSLNAHGRTLAFRGDSEAPEVVDELVALAREQGHLTTLANAFTIRAPLRLARGDLAGAVEDIDGLEALIEEGGPYAGGTLGGPWAIASLAAGHRAGLAVLTGDAAAVDAWKARSIDASLGDLEAQVPALVAGIVMDYHRSNLAGLVAVIEMWAAATKPAVSAPAVIRVLAAQEEGDATGARPQVAAFMELVRDTPRSALYRPFVVAMGVDACAAFGFGDLAVTLEHELRAVRGQIVLMFASALAPLGSGDRMVGQLAAIRRDWDEAEDCFRSAIELENRVESPLLLAHTHHWYGRMLLDRAAPGDRGRGRDLLSQAQATAKRLGMAQIERASAQLLSIA